jgi:hypothetical protein
MMDNVLDIARVARDLLSDPYAPQEGLEALKTHKTQASKRGRNSFSLNYAAQD